MSNISKLLRRYATPVVIIIMGIVLVVFGNVRKQRDSSYIKTEGVITAIESDYDFATETEEHTVYVKYTVDGVEYNSTMGDFEASFKEGQTIKIAYNPANPSEILYQGGVSMGLIIGIGIAAIVVGAVLLVLTFLKILPWVRD